jgi:NADH-quinone oxidoreductase subunit F
VPLGTSLLRIVEERGGGAPGGIGLVFPAGPSAAPLTAAEADEVPLDPEALRAAGSALGTASMLVMDASTCPVSLAASLAAFFERESCGQCPPCTLGAASLARVTRGLEAATARGAELSHLSEVAGFMTGHGYCAHSRTAAAAVQGLLARVRPHVEGHLARGHCPDDQRAADPFRPDSAERTAIEAALAAIAPRGEARVRP